MAATLHPGARGMDGQEWVYVVDDDLSVREALSSLIRSVGLQVETHTSAAAFLEAPRQPRVASHACSSNPLRPGMRTSRIRQATRGSRGTSRKAAADG